MISPGKLATPLTVTERATAQRRCKATQALWATAPPRLNEHSTAVIR